MLADRCPVLSVCNVGVLWPNGWMDQDATWCGGRPRPRPRCVRWRHSSPMEKGTAAPLSMAHVYCSHTVAHLSYCWSFVFVMLYVATLIELRLVTDRQADGQTDAGP